MGEGAPRPLRFPGALRPGVLVGAAELGCGRAEGMAGVHLDRVRIHPLDRLQWVALPPP